MGAVVYLRQSRTCSSAHGERDQPEPCGDSAFLKTKLPGLHLGFLACKVLPMQQAEGYLVLLAALLTGFISAWGKNKKVKAKSFYP